MNENWLPLPIPQGRDAVTGAWAARLVRRVNAQRILFGRGFRVLSRGPDGIRVEAEAGGAARAAGEGLRPFACRFHVTEDDEEGKWEVYLPKGCLAVGGTCEALNVPMSDVDGHDGEDGWHLLVLDEGEGEAFRTRTEKEGAVSVTVKEKRWEVVVHGKTRAKVEGVDKLDAPARRLLYVSDVRTRGSGEDAPTAEERAKDCWGDEFSQVTGTIHVEERSGGGRAKPETTRRHAAGVRSSISVAGRADQNFDLVWHFKVDGTTGALSVTHVYCVRNSSAIGGMDVDGPTMKEVTDAKESLWVRIDTNRLVTGLGAKEDVLDVVMDPKTPSSDDFATWLKIYGIANNVVSADYRASALVNAITYR